MFDQKLYGRMRAESLAYWDDVCRRASLYDNCRHRPVTPFDTFATEAFCRYGDCRWKGYLDMMCYWDHQVDTGFFDVTARAAMIDAIVRTDAGDDRFFGGKEPNPGSKFDLDRFVSAQNRIHSTAAEELRAEHKASHWMWFEFPQMRGLGYSDWSRHYGISGIEEAREYLQHPLLASRLYELCAILLNRMGEPVRHVFGSPDDMKLRSSMTLFDQVEPKGIFADVLDAFYEGGRCERTLKLVNVK